MRTGMVIGVALGTVLGAMLVSGNPALTETVEKGKSCVKGKARRLKSMFK